jgi:hypothetical protein
MHTAHHSPEKRWEAKLKMAKNAKPIAKNAIKRLRSPN